MHNLQNQSKNIQELNEEFEKFNNDRKETEEFMRLDKEENELKYNERKKLEEYLKRTQQQNELMKNYSEDLKKNLKESSESANPEFQKELEKRMEETEQKLEENEELLRELEKYTDKIEKEDLGKKLEELSKNNRNTERSLEQLLELTKRYYVEEKKQKFDLEHGAKAVREAKNKQLLHEFILEDNKDEINEWQELGKKLGLIDDDFDAFTQERPTATNSHVSDTAVATHGVHTLMSHSIDHEEYHMPTMTDGFLAAIHAAEASNPNPPPSGAIKVI